MKIGVMSDVHLEFGALSGPLPNVDVMVLAGDIFVVDDYFVGSPDYDTVRDFAKMVTDYANYVVFVPGNHEFYHSEYFQALDKMREMCEEFDFYFLHNDQATIEGKHFIGSTLWSDADEIVASKMNDYRVIDHGEGRLTVRDTNQMHEEAVKFLHNNIGPGSIVVTHHLPSFKSISEGFKYFGHGVNSAYATNLEWMMGDPAIWIHGHSHHPVDYVVNGTRIVSNPRGYYRHEKISRNFEVKVYES